MISIKRLFALSLAMNVVFVVTFLLQSIKIFLANQSDGLLVWYEFEEESGNTAEDSSGNSNNGVIESDKNNFSRYPGKAGRYSLYLGIGSCVSVPMRNTDKNEISIALWIKPAESNLVNTIVTNCGINNNNWSLSLYENGDNSYSVVFLIGEEEFTSKNKIQNNTWTHVAFTIDKNNNYSLYINGAPDTQYICEKALPPLPDMLYIGDCKLPWYNMIGCVDDFRLYDRALGKDEIRQIYEKSLSNPSPSFSDIPAPSPSVTSDEIINPLTPDPSETPMELETTKPETSPTESSSEHTSIPGGTTETPNPYSMFHIMIIISSVIVVSGAGIYLIMNRNLRRNEK